MDDSDGGAGNVRRSDGFGILILLTNEQMFVVLSSPPYGHVARMGERRGACKVLVGKHEGKRPLGRPKCRLENNIKMYLQ